MVPAVQPPVRIARGTRPTPISMDGTTPVRPLISLANCREVKILGLAGAACERLTQEELAQGYLAEMAHSPDRASVGKTYLSHTRDGVPGTGTFTNRNEEHLAIAIFNAYRPPAAGLQLPNGEELHIVDYQLPLKARRSDSGVGKVDLFGVTGSGQAAVVELKAATGGDTPLRAVLEGLAYTAILQANLATIRKEVLQRYSLMITSDVPRLIVMAPEEYWAGFRTRLPKGWEEQVEALADRILQGTGVAVDFVALGNWDFVRGLAATRPVLHGPLVCVPVLRGNP